MAAQGPSRMTDPTVNSAKIFNTKLNRACISFDILQRHIFICIVAASLLFLALRRMLVLPWGKAPSDLRGLRVEDFVLGFRV